ncbi:MAG TPA: radical SAM protein [Pyrinomonadaceae bacterium]|nr:radical SAM protein [Pyrinomonadaceae bacterium]
MFSTHDRAIRNNIFSTLDVLSEADGLNALDSTASYDPNIARVLWTNGLGQDGAVDQVILLRSQKAKQDIYRGSVYAVVPVYSTSICMEECGYCNYRAGNKGFEVERIRLKDDELVSEARFLIEQKGLRALELVYATDPLVRADAMCRQVKLIKKVLDEYGGGTVGINAEPLEIEDYKQLVDSGLSFAVLWQETYDRRRYGEVHVGKTKKPNFAYRVDAYERMIRAGITNIGMGVLSGLSDWKLDWAMLMHHEHYLRETFGVGAAILGIPRLKVAAGAVVTDTPFIPTRQEFLVAVALHNIYSPNTMPFVSTRENWQTCVQLSRGGGCLFTFNCSTIPGGYSLGHTGYQFPTYSYDVVAYADQLQKENLSAVLNWTLNGTGVQTLQALSFAAS